MRKILRILLYILGGIFVLLLIVIIVLQTSFGKNLLREQIVKFLRKKLQTEVLIARLDYSIPDKFLLEGVLIMDRQKDTLIQVQQLSINMDMLALLRTRISVDHFLLDGVYANVYRPLPDTVFNYNFIIEAFSGSDTLQEGPQPADTATSSGSLKLDIAKVTLKNIRLRYDDETGGTFFSLNLGDLVLRPKNIDLEQMKFGVEELTVNRLQSFFATDTSYIVQEPKTDTGSTPFNLVADKISLENIKFAFLNKQDSLYFGILVGNLGAAVREFDLEKQWVDISTFQLEQVQSSFVIGKSGKKEEKSTEDTLAGNNDWKVRADQLMLKQIAFAMDDNNIPRQKEGMDYSHLDIRNLFLNGEQVYYSPDTISGNIKHIALNERSGLSVIELRTSFLYHNKGATLNKLYLRTPDTELQDRIVVRYPSLETLQKDLGKMYIDIGINKSKVGINDVLLFMQPGQRSMLLPYKSDVIHLTADIKGLMNALSLNNFMMSGLKGTEVLLSGKLNGLPDADKLAYNLQIKNIRSVYPDIAPFLPDSLKQQMNIPAWVAITGSVRGTMNDYYPDLIINTADGNVKVAGSLLMAAGEGNERYDLQVATDGLNIGRILKMDTVLGTVTMNGKVKGIGFDPEKMNTVFDLHIASALYNKYNYQGIHLNGEIAHKLATIKGRSTDPNVQFDLNAVADLNGTYPALNAEINMGNIDVQALGFYSDTLRLKGLLRMDFADLNPDYPEGTLTYENAEIRLPGYGVQLDSIFVRSEPGADSSQNIFVNVANILRLNMDGHVPLTQTGNMILAHINDYFRITDSNLTAYRKYDMNVDATVSYHPTLKTWLPGLKPFDTIRAGIRINSEQFNIDAFVPKVVYNDNYVDSGVLKVFNTGDTLRYSASLKKFAQGQFQLWYPTVRGGVRNDSLYTRITLKDSTGNEQFALGGAIHHDIRDSGLTYVRLFKGLLLDYEHWDVDPRNRMVLGPSGFNVQDVTMTRGNQLIRMGSITPEFNAPLKLAINNFSLSNLTRTISRDTLIADGILGLEARVDLRDSFPKIDVAGNITDLQVYNENIGALDFLAKNETESNYYAKIRLSGNDNNITLSGNYFLTPVDSNDFKFELDMEALSLKSVQGLAFGSIKNSSGFLKGKLSLAGTTNRPIILGALYTDRLQTTVTMLNAPFLMPSETIKFNKQGMVFDNFTIKDKNGQSAVLKGTIRSRDFTRYFLDLNLRMNRWLAVNSTKKDNDLFYGKLVLSSNLDMKGLATAPKISGDLTIHDSTNLTYAMIDMGPGIQETNGIVRFIDSRDTTWIDSTQIRVPGSMRMSRAAQMNVNVGIDKEAIFNVVIDPVTGDNLQVKGQANLNTFMGPDGSVGLTGTYELTDGYYELNYNFLKRKFKIVPGSTISLSGDPMDAEVDITAAYSANIAPYELMEKQIDQSELNFYKQRLPFSVQLKLKGKVMQPEITFDIVLPEDKVTMVRSDIGDNVQRKLSEIRNDASTLNKQVFAILILGRFISENPFESAGGGVEYAARQSASRFLSDQLNHIAGELVQGFDLNVGLESSEDYSTGQKSNRTDLNISASKRLFNDRLNITVGNDFQLEGQQAQSQQSALIPGNISADYRVSKDGRYLVRAYRVNELQNIIDGYVIETGVSFRISIEYNRFKSIFRSRKKYMERRRQQTEQGDETKNQPG